MLESLGKAANLLVLNMHRLMVLRGMAKPSKTRAGKFQYDYETLAELAGLTRSGVYKVGKGLTWPSPDNLDRIAQALKVTPGSLLYDPENDLPPPISFEQAKAVVLAALEAKTEALVSAQQAGLEKSSKTGTPARAPDTVPAGKARRR